VSSEGDILFHYRKTHLWGEYEAATFTRGYKLPGTFSINGIPISALICYDFEFPENCRIQALKGTKILVVPTAANTPFIATTMCSVRAYENNIFVGYINLAGCHDGTSHGGIKASFCGNSGMYGPDGIQLVPILSSFKSSPSCDNHSSGYIVVKIDTSLEQYNNSENPYLIDRRPELYQKLAV